MKTLEARAMKMRKEMERGRGGEILHPFPVSLEPPFSPFAQDKGKRQVQQASSQAEEFERVEPQELSFLRVRPSKESDFSEELSEQMLLSLNLGQLLVFEVIGFQGRSAIQIAASPQLISSVSCQISAHYPKFEVFPARDILQREGLRLSSAQSYQLRDSHLFSLRTRCRTEPYAALLGLFGGLKGEECALFQVLFLPVKHNWRGNILTVCRDPWDPTRSAFIDLPQLPKQAEEKARSPLFATAVRLAASSQELLTRIEGSFLPHFEGQENGFIPFGPYPVKSILKRTSHTHGMLLNSGELTALVHLPDPENVPDVLRIAEHTRSAPRIARENILAPLGFSRHKGEIAPVGISAEWLTRHIAIFGGTGMGKTNLLKFAFAPLLSAGYGLALLDPKGDAASGFLNLIPESRIDDVIYFDPTDRGHPPGLNVLASSSGLENEKLTAELMVGLKRLFHGPGELGQRTEWLLRQSIRTLLDSEGEKTLKDIPEFLENSEFRAKVLQSVKDRELQSFWERRDLSSSVITPIINRLGSFLDRPTIRDIVTQPNRIDFHQILREGKIFIANLSKGELRDAAFVLGSFILSRIQMAALARPKGFRALYPVLIDEFHNFAGHGMDTTSTEIFLSEARSFRVPLVIATQYPSQLAQPIIKAVFGNVGTLISMHCGVIDAKLLEQEFSNFEAQNIQNRGIGQALVRMGISNNDFNLEIPEVREQPSPHLNITLARSREKISPPKKEQEIASQCPPESEKESKIIALEPDEVSFLQRIAVHPEETVTAACQAVGMGGFRAAKIRKALIERALIVEVNTRLGQKGKRAKYAVPTLAGFLALGQKPHKGRGGPVHKYFGEIIRRWAEAKGYQVTVERRLDKGGWVDLHLEGNGPMVAIEISVSSTPEREMNNLRKCLEAGYSQVVVLFLDKAVYKSCQSQLAKDLENKVKLGRLNDFHLFL